MLTRVCNFTTGQGHSQERFADWLSPSQLRPNHCSRAVLSNDDVSETRFRCNKLESDVIPMTSRSVFAAPPFPLSNSRVSHLSLDNHVTSVPVDANCAYATPWSCSPVNQHEPVQSSPRVTPATVQPHQVFRSLDWSLESCIQRSHHLALDSNPSSVNCSDHRRRHQTKMTLNHNDNDLNHGKPTLVARISDTNAPRNGYSGISTFILINYVLQSFKFLSRFLMRNLRHLSALVDLSILSKGVGQESACHNLRSV